VLGSEAADVDRSVRILGREGQRLLQNLRIGVVGTGGTGSIVVTALATMGVGRLRCWDHDRIKKHNRPRLVSTHDSHIGQKKVEALCQEARRLATAKPFTAEAHDAWGTSKEAIVLLRDCDIVFSCVDLFGARVPLNDLAYAHLIPVIDMGTKIYPEGKDIGAILCHAQTLAPGLPCAWCNGTVSTGRLVAEAQGAQAGAEKKAAYGIPFEATDGVEPSVLPFNLASVGLSL